MRKMSEILAENPVLAGVKNEEELKICCGISEMQVVSTLYGTICTIGEIVKELKDAGKMVFVHTDLVNGLSGRDAAADFIYEFTQADGIITTRVPVIQQAKKLGLYTILRVFMLDSMAYKNILREVAAAQPDCLEVLPGPMPKIVRRITRDVTVPVIAGGLITDREDILVVRAAGAASASTSDPRLWKVTL